MYVCTYKYIHININIYIYKTQSCQKLRDQQPGDHFNNLEEIRPGNLDLGGQSRGDERR